MESILNTIKKMLGIDPDYDAFDVDLIVDINMVFGILKQLGVGPVEGYSIVDAYNTWDEYETDQTIIGMVETYIYLKVKQIFDPGNNAVNGAIEAQVKELESRLIYEVD